MYITMNTGLPIMPINQYTYMKYSIYWHMRYCVYTYIYIYTLIIEREREVANVGHRIRIEDTHMSHMRSQRVYVDVYSTHM